MFPVLFTIGKVAVSSYGVFLALGFLFGIFLIWRLARAWDMDEERVLDLTLITFLGGLLGARIYFVMQHPGLFSQNLGAIFLFYKLPGFSFWGGILGGWLTLYYFARKSKDDFLMLADIAAVGLLGGIILSNIGCFLGGCMLGIQSTFLGFKMVGILGNRFPVQILEAGLFYFVLLKIWSVATRFHQRGKILSLVLIYIGAVKILTESLKALHNESFYFSAVLFALGVNIFYKITGRNILRDLKILIAFLGGLFTDPSIRKYTLARIGKYCYNRKTEFLWRFRNFKKILRRINVRISYKNNKVY